MDWGGSVHSEMLGVLIIDLLSPVEPYAGLKLTQKCSNLRVWCSQLSTIAAACEDGSCGISISNKRTLEC